ncbi:MAG: rhodanese-like domain-containing protein [Betaproteobacteria bacterium]
MNEYVLNVSAYRFVALDNLSELRARLLAFCEAADVRGTVLLADEGINLSVAGAASSISALRAVLDCDLRLASMTYKESWSERTPFRRLKIKIRREIVSFGIAGIDPARRPAPALQPEMLKAWLDEGRSVVLLDTRNAVEYAQGSFSGAIQLGNTSFRGFAAAAGTLVRTSTATPVVTFCTGGIRCEKAAPLLLQLGHPSVYQLSGGILNYFRCAGDAHYRGDCFVFDERTALDSALQPSRGQSPVQP